jgi:predicted HicB family RNase H-like nuclease
MTPPAGRPKSDRPRSKVVPVRFDETGHAAVAAAAKAAGKTLSTYIADAALAAAKRKPRVTGKRDTT